MGYFLKILLLLPELQEGGVERHVLLLANGMARRGHSVTVVSAGGALEALFLPSVQQIVLPIHKKNPLTAIACAFRLAAKARGKPWDLLHAHSRVPDWIAWMLSALTATPWVVTAHARYSKNYGITPLPHADALIAISRVVLDHLSHYLPQDAEVIYNALPGKALASEAPSAPPLRMLYVGRLTRIKGIDVLLQALASVRGAWRLDVAGDGPLMPSLREQVRLSGIDDKVCFHGFCRNVEEMLSQTHLFLFPSLDEGMGLALMEAIRAGVPLFASNIGAVRELLGETEGLLPPGDCAAWEKALQDAVEGKLPKSYSLPLPDSEAMLTATESVYRRVVSKKQ